MEQVSSLKTGVKYKDTPIGKIPVDWEVLKLNNIGELKGGNGFSEKYQGHRDLKYLFIKVSDMNLPCNDIYIRNSINTIDDELKEILKCNIFPRDTIVFAKVGAALLLNRRRIITKESAIDNNMMGLIVKKGYYPKFYYYILQTIDFAKYVFSGALPSVNQKIIGDIDVVSPPLNEQKGIAEILTTVDKAIEKTSQIIEKTKEVKKGLMQRLLTRGIGHKRFKRTEIGEIPEEWGMAKLKDIALRFYNGGTPDTSNENYWGGDIPWITGADFENQKVNRIRRNITHEGVENSATNIIPKGNLLVATRTGVGKLAIAPFDIAISQDITGIILDSQKALPGYIYWYLDHKADRLRSIIQGTSINGLLRGDLESFMLPLPLVNEQKKIAYILTSIDDEVEKEMNHKEQLETLKKGLMQVLLTGKLRVTV